MDVLGHILRKCADQMTLSILIGFLAFKPSWSAPTKSVPLGEGSPSTAVEKDADRSSAPLKTIAILDPVDLGINRNRPVHGDFLRGKLQGSGNWNPLSRMETEKKLIAFNWNPFLPCHEFQCGFDAGNVLLTEYLLFGSVTDLGELYAYTFNVLHVPTAQIVHSEVGDVLRKNGPGGDNPLKVQLERFVENLHPSKLNTKKQAEKAERGLMAVVDLGGNSPLSRVMAERVATHVYASGRYDLMSQRELTELVGAMGIRLSSYVSADSSMLALGAKLNVAHLVYSKLSRENKGHRLDLALFDVGAKQKVREWPSPSFEDFRGLLHFERRFFTTITEEYPVHRMSHEKEKSKLRRPKPYWRGALSGVGFSAAAGLAYMAYSSRQDANVAHSQAEKARSRENAREQKRIVDEKDLQAGVYGLLAGLSLGASVTLWTF